MTYLWRAYTNKTIMDPNLTSGFGCLATWELDVSRRHGIALNHFMFVGLSERFCRTSFSRGGLGHGTKLKISLRLIGSSCEIHIVRVKYL